MTHKVYMTDAMRKHIVDEHNKFRRIVANFVQASNMVEVVYDMKLEQVAQDYLYRNPTWKGHNYNMDRHYKAIGGIALGLGLGENWSGAPPKHATANWVGGYGHDSSCPEDQIFWSRNG